MFQIYNRRIGKTPFILEITRREAVDINTLADFQLAEHLLDFKEKDDE